MSILARACGVLVSTFILGSVFAAEPASGSATKHSGAAGTRNWLYHNGSSDETAYSSLQQVNAANVDRLGLASFLDLPGEQMLEATPLAVNGVLYFTGSYATVYAVDAVSGKILWTHDPQIWKHGPYRMRFMLPANRGVAYADGRVFVGTLDGRLIALNARSGKLLWSVETVSPQSLQTITGAPRVFNGKVIIGNGGADYGVRGYVTAYDAVTGRQVWRFYTVPGTPNENHGDPAMERAAATWNGEYWKTGTGGGPWDNFTFDRESNRVYIGTGNAAPYDPAQRSPGGGDNLYTASIVALDADTGHYVWHYQVNPGDSWDFDSTAQMILADLTIDGRPRKVLMQAPKNGFLYVLDRTNGKVISAGKIGKVTWADHIDLTTGRPAEENNVRYQEGDVTLWPTAAGAHNWHSMSFSPQTGLIYIPYMQVGMRYSKHFDAQGMLGGVNMAAVKVDPQDGKGALVAWDPVQQHPRWKVQHDYLWNGGTLASGGGLVFQGKADGFFCAYDARTGRELWRYNAGLGIIAAPISYSVNGKQYISVLVGYGGANSMGLLKVGWKYDAQPRRLLTFSLEGKTALPPSAPRDLSVHPVDDPSIQIDDADVAPGQVLFTAYCSVCHGQNADSGGAPAPDLRESTVALRRESLRIMLHDGALLSQGMPRFEDLDESQVRQIHAFIRTRAREALKASGQVDP